MSLTKKQLIDAHEQGLNVQTKNGSLKIMAVFNDSCFAVNHFNSEKIHWWTLKQFIKVDAKIEQPKPKVDLSILNTTDVFYLKTKTVAYVFTFDRKNDVNIYFRYQLHLTEPNHKYVLGMQIDYILELRLATESEIKLLFPNYKKYNGRAVKCDSVEQATYVSNMVAGNSYTPIVGYFCVCIKHPNNQLGWNQSVEYMENCNYEIISFSQYCQEQGIKEPKWIQGFLISDNYKDVVMVSHDNESFHVAILSSVYNGHNPFITTRGSFKYARYPRKNEINEIKFVD